MDLAGHVEKIMDDLEKDQFKGYDPYDALNSPILNSLPGKWPKIAATQFMVYFPINLRPVLGIRKMVNPKSTGLILKALCGGVKKGIWSIEQAKRRMDLLKNWMTSNYNNEYSGPCWGYHFPWQDLHKYIPRYHPSIVVTSTIGTSLLDLEELADDEAILSFTERISQFILNDLNVYRDADGSCFSYSPFDRNVVHNANLLGAEFLLRLGNRTGSDELIDRAMESYGFTINKQNDDGSWYYSIDPQKGTAREQFDFHQGFVLDSLMTLYQHDGSSELKKVIRKGMAFYEKLIDDRGRTYFRYPRKYPVDIHNQAQFIITSQGYNRIFTGNNNDKALKYLLDNMISRKNGTYHQVWPLIKNRNNYSRWGDSWTLLALVRSL